MTSKDLSKDPVFDEVQLWWDFSLLGHPRHSSVLSCIFSLCPWHYGVDAGGAPCLPVPLPTCLSPCLVKDPMHMSAPVQQKRKLHVHSSELLFYNLLGLVLTHLTNTHITNQSFCFVFVGIAVCFHHHYFVWSRSLLWCCGFSWFNGFLNGCQNISFRKSSNHVTKLFRKLKIYISW